MLSKSLVIKLYLNIICSSHTFSFKYCISSVPRLSYPSCSNGQAAPGTVCKKSRGQSRVKCVGPSLFYSPSRAALSRKVRCHTWRGVTQLLNMQTKTALTLSLIISGAEIQLQQYAARPCILFTIVSVLRVPCSWLGKQ